MIAVVLLVMIASPAWYGCGRTSAGEAGGGSQAGGNDEPVPDVEGKPIEMACRRLEQNGHAGEMSFIRKSEGVEPGRVLVQDIEPGTNEGTSKLVYLTVSVPFGEKELSPDTACANPEPDSDDAR